jgi:hypothetical protein
MCVRRLTRLVPKFTLSDLCGAVTGCALVFASLRFDPLLGAASGGILVGAVVGRVVSAMPSGWFFGAVYSAWAALVCLLCTALVLPWILGPTIVLPVAIYGITAVGFVVGGYRGGTIARSTETPTQK